jgi:uncharacterized protein (TIGR02145 family)
MFQVHAQDYMISFAGTGDTTVVSNVKVYNLTSGDSVTLKGGDILHLAPFVGIGKLDRNNETMQLYPNPMDGQAFLTFFAPENGDALIRIVDLSGKTVYQFNKLLSPGTHSFRVTGVRQGMYLLKITGKNYNYSTKLVSMNYQNSNAGIEYTSSIKNTKENHLKNGEAIIDMNFTGVDRLLFMSTTGKYSTVVTDVPTSSKTISFNFAACNDADNNNYAIVTIGTQVWMFENLKTTKFNDGTFIPEVTAPSAWAELTTPGYCWYNNDISNKHAYGALYNGFAVNTAKLAPVGWHVPSDAEWKTLTEYLGGMDIAGGKLKDAGPIEWLSPNGGATNETGFTALPGGQREIEDGMFYDIGMAGAWWSATANDYPFIGWMRGVNYLDGALDRDDEYGAAGFSVRCLRDFVPTNITFVNIPAGSFTMGSPITEVNRYEDETQHQVTLSAFRMSKYEITNAEYAIFLNAKSIGENGLYPAGTYPNDTLIYSSKGGKYDWGLHYTNGKWIPVAGYESYPANLVTWYGATEFATFVGGRLPTEAEWEYACRANTATPFNTGACLSNTQANYDWAFPYGTCTNTNTNAPSTNQKVGMYPANAYGLHDMHGNVWEWCSDWYGNYSITPQNNPTGPLTGTLRVRRGGSGNRDAKGCRSAIRIGNYPNVPGAGLGFRIVVAP